MNQGTFFYAPLANIYNDSNVAMVRIYLIISFHLPNPPLREDLKGLRWTSKMRLVSCVVWKPIEANGGKQLIPSFLSPMKSVNSGTYTTTRCPALPLCLSYPSIALIQAREEGDGAEEFLLLFGLQSIWRVKWIHVTGISVSCVGKVSPHLMVRSRLIQFALSSMIWFRNHLVIRDTRVDRI